MSLKSKAVILPRSGPEHYLFGIKFLRRHKIRDSKWQPIDRFQQYGYITDIVKKDQNLTNLKGIADSRKQIKKLRTLRREVKDVRDKLKVALNGDIQRTKNILQNHKELQRLYTHMPPGMIIDNMDQRTFVKRKELDRLLYRKRQLSKEYKTKLMKFAKAQDRIRFMDVFDLKEDDMGKRLRMELKNSETRMRAIKTISRAYKKIISIMMHDSIYFDPVLDALQEDINEQEDFINKTIQLGLPALANFDLLSKEFNVLEVNTRKEMKMRMEQLLATRERIQENNMAVRKLVRRDSDFAIYPHRYDRETVSMLDLKVQLEDVEKIMKLVKNATSCARAEDVYPRMKKQIRDNQRLESNVIRRERERNAMITKDDQAHVVKEALQHDLTDVEIARVEEIKRLKEEIADEQRKQSEYSQHMKKRGEIFCYIRTAFQHLMNALRHVGMEHVPDKKQYPDEDLNLPLLKFNAFVPKAKPPSPYEEDAETLLRVVKDRVSILMKAYQQEKAQEEIKKGENEYHKAILRDLHEEVIKTIQEPDEAPLLATSDDDPNVPNRELIKAISAKIVEANAKTEDDI